MITELTTEQQAALVAHRQRFFEMATCTDLADRPRAEAAARALAEIAGAKVGTIAWVSSPDAGKAQYDRAWASLGASLRASLGDSLRASLGASLGDSLGASLGDSLGDSLRASLRASLWASLGDSLWASLGDSLWASLWDSLGDSLWANLRDSSWIALYAFGRDLGVVYDPAEAIKLDLWIATLESCFAIWIVPGTIILCERPATVEIVDGNLVGLTWKT
jgi:hypothetical protein